MHTTPVRWALGHPDVVGCDIVADRATCEKRRDGNAALTGRTPDDYTIEPVAPCQCCGFLPTVLGMEFPRCRKHVASNPCAIEGCSRTRSAKDGLDNGDYWLCRDHWRLACPPHSPSRRAYNRFFRIAKKLGISPGGRWPTALENRYWRFWFGLVARARRKAVGDVDMTEINKMFGWD